MGGDSMTETFSKTNSKAIMTVHEVAQYLRLSQAKVYRLTKGGYPRHAYWEALAFQEKFDRQLFPSASGDRIGIIRL
jgi:hypothetical protein